MGKVIQFPPKAPDEQTRRLLEIANEIDEIIVRHLSHGDLEARDLAGLMAHRLGTLMRHIDEKDKLWDVCERVLKAQAAIE